MVTITRRNLGPYRLIKFKQTETSRGVYWSGQITCRGATIGDVENRGDGGATHVSIRDAVARSEFQAFLAALQPQMPADPAFPALPASTQLSDFEENFALWLSEEAELVKRAKRQVKKATVLVLNTDSEGTMRILRQPFTKELGDQLRARYGHTLVCIVNEVVDQLS